MALKVAPALVVEVVEVEGQVVYRMVAPSGVVVESTVGFLAPHWWDRHVLLGMVGSYMLWCVNIAADGGWTKPKKWLKSLDNYLN